MRDIEYILFSLGTDLRKEKLFAEKRSEHWLFILLAYYHKNKNKKLLFWNINGYERIWRALAAR